VKNKTVADTEDIQISVNIGEVTRAHIVTHVFGATPSSEHPTENASSPSYFPFQNFKF